MNRVIDIAVRLHQKGHYPFIPHLFHFVHLRTRHLGFEIDYEDYMLWHDAYLHICEAILWLDSSPGAERELNRACDLRKTIFFSEDDIRPVHDTEKFYPVSQERL